MTLGGKMTKLITIEHVKDTSNMSPIYDTEMRVVQSNHPRFSEGTRFDFGFFNIATKEGYMIVSLPMDWRDDGES